MAYNDQSAMDFFKNKISNGDEPDGETGPAVPTPGPTTVKPEKKKMSAEEWKKLMAKFAIVLIAYAFANWLHFGGYIKYTTSTLVTINLLLTGGLVASYLHGNPKWSLHTKLFVMALMVVVIAIFWTKLEHNRKAGDSRTIEQKIYDKIGNWFDPQTPNPQTQPGSEGEKKKIKTTDIYPRGTHHISLKAGQTTERWITFPDGVRIGLGSDDLQFKIIYPDGTIKEAWKLKKTPERYKFKLLAVTDQVIKLRVI